MCCRGCINEESPRVKRCKKILQGLSIGEVNTGLYYKSKQQYLSATSGIWTVLGLLLIIGLTVNVFIGIANRT